METTRIRDRMRDDMILRGLSDNTIRAYLGQARRFVEHFKGRSPLRLGNEEVRDYLLHRCTVDKRSAVTACQTLASLKFLYEVTLHRPEVVAEIPFPRVPQQLPPILTGSEVQRLLTVVYPVKNHVLACLCYGLGLRAMEALTLRPEHIDGSRGVLHVRQGKGRRDRDLPLHPKLLTQLRQYWRAVKPPRDGYLFPGEKPGSHVSYKAFQSAFSRAANSAGIRKEVSPHTLRHCFATHTLLLGGRLENIQRLLGHSSIVTTMRYLRVTPERLVQTRNPFELLGTGEDEPLG